MLATQQNSVRFRREILDADSGLIVKTSPWSRNVITDWGLEAMATYTIGDLWKVLVLGTGAKVTKRDSGVITASKTGQTVTASAGFFEAGDVGRVIKFDNDAAEYRVTSYDPAGTSVNVDIAGTVPAQEFTVWYCNDATHAAELMRVSAFATDAGFNGTPLIGATATHRRTFMSTAFLETKNITEIGWSNTTAAGSPMYGRALVPGGGDLVAAGQQYRVQVELSQTYGPTVPQALANVCADPGFSTAGGWALEFLEPPRLNDQGNTQLGGTGYYNWLQALEPVGGTAAIGVSTDATPLRNMSANALSFAGDLDPGSTVNGNAPAVAYIAGSRRRYWRAEFSTAQCNSSAIRSVMFGSPAWGPRMFIRALFDTPQTKDSLHKLSFTFGLQWGRALVN